MRLLGEEKEILICMAMSNTSLCGLWERSRVWYFKKFLWLLEHASCRHRYSGMDPACVTQIGLGYIHSPSQRFPFDTVRGRNLLVMGLETIFSGLTTYKPFFPLCYHGKAASACMRASSTHLWHHYRYSNLWHKTHDLPLHSLVEIQMCKPIP